MTTTTVSATPANLKDFPDFFSPVVVKELRQALRGGVFMGLFFSLQAAMLLFTLLTMLAAEETSSELDLWFWGITSLTITCLLPATSIGALSSESKRDTFGLLSLTRMNSWRIVFGKWIAITALGGLVTVTMLPYFVFRYFRGGVNIGSELLQLAIVCSLGASVAAMGVAFSALRPALLRWSCYAVYGVPVGVWTLMMVDGEIEWSRQASFPWAMISGGLFLCYYGITMGAGWIARDDENFSIHKRISTMVVLVLILLLEGTMGWDADFERPMELITAVLVIVFLFDSCSERPQPSRAIAARMLENRLLRPLRWLLYPGWQSGMLYVIPSVAALLACLWELEDWDPGFVVILAICLSGIATFPTAIIQLVAKDRDRFVGKYCVVLLVNLAYLTVLGVFLEDAIDYGASGLEAIVMALTPLSAAILGEQAILSYGDDSVLVLGSALTVAFQIWLLVRALVVFGQFSKVETLARGGLAAARWKTAEAIIP